MNLSHKFNVGDTVIHKLGQEGKIKQAFRFCYSNGKFREFGYMVYFPAFKKSFATFEKDLSLL